ncbi:hypothetical protein AB0O05_41175 [Streptomyces sp. NPDC093084]|uniref:hypothetical protein n=1 Tax=Streptomyces sp. NPDC093084 TaxID=3155197 RepID=UPI0034423676
MSVPRLTRAAVFAAVCLTVTALGHALMSGDAETWRALGLAFPETFAGAWWLARRQRRAPAVVGATVLTQGLLHLLFNLVHVTAGRPAAGPAVMPMDMGSTADGATHETMNGMSGMAPSSGAATGAVMAHASTPGMLLAHLLAALVCGWWLWRGEEAAGRIALALPAFLFAPLLRTLRVLFGTIVRCGAGHDRALSDRVPADRAPLRALRHVMVRRGPPAPGDRSSTDRHAPAPVRVPFPTRPAPAG